MNTADPVRVVRPALRVPFDSAASPHSDEVDGRVVEWALHAGLAPEERTAPLRRSRLGLLAGRTHPRADVDTVTDVAVWYAWLAIFDGYCDEPATVRDPVRFGAHLIRLLRVLESDTSRASLPDGADAAGGTLAPGGALAADGALASGGIPAAAGGFPATGGVPDGVVAGDGWSRAADPFAAALADLRDRVRARATADQMRRLALSVHGYFMGLLWEGGHRRLGEGSVSFEDYRYIRRHAGGVPTWLMLMEIFGGNRPSPGDLAHPDMVALSTRIADVLTWQNDIVSYRAELASGVRVLSLPTVLGRERGLPEQRALEAAADLLTIELDGYLAAEGRVLDWAGPALTGYVADLRDLVAGCLTWHLETGRYS
ncbi:terpene synthase family protein [Rhizomonospora bruguierae]|uniref:terpene synthase family protein n=1 Tax=Rhizomonospora bruguierae TaxID=1581705 RepID=UPI001BCD8830|nr:hypothetical protein [Micromonospora sp. NBRC 107566]